jgi:hypothetical protein
MPYNIAYVPTKAPQSVYIVKLTPNSMVSDNFYPQPGMSFP